MDMMTMSSWHSALPTFLTQHFQDQSPFQPKDFAPQRHLFRCVTRYICVTQLLVVAQCFLYDLEFVWTVLEHF